MSELSKSKMGMLLAGMYLVLVLFCQIYIRLIDNSISLPMILSMILVAPWFYLFSYLNVLLGINFTHEIAGSKNVDYRSIVDNVETALSVLINASILYFLGSLLTKKAYKSFSSGRE